MPGLSRQAAVAGGVPLPDMPRAGSLGHGAGLASLPGVRSADLGDGGTLFADTHLPLRLWFEALWHVTGQKSGGSALGLQRVLGLGSYRTAWNLLHKLRRAMVRPGRGKVSSRSMRSSSAGHDRASEDAARTAAGGPPKINQLT